MSVSIIPCQEKNYDVLYEFYGYSDLMKAIMYRSQKQIDDLINNKKSFYNDNHFTLDYVADDGWTALMMAVGEKQLDVVQRLIKAGVSLELQKYKGWTPLIIAAANGSENLVDCLIKGGANLESQNNEHQTALSIAARNGWNKVVQILVRNGAFLETKDLRGMTPLAWAIFSDYREIIIFLLLEGSYIELPKNDENPTRIGNSPIGDFLCSVRYNDWTHYLRQNKHFNLLGSFLKLKREKSSHSYLSIIPQDIIRIIVNYF